MISNYELGKHIQEQVLMTIVAELDFYAYFTSEPKRFYEGPLFFRSQSAATKRAGICKLSDRISKGNL